MNSKDFIKSHMQRLVKKFTTLKTSYSFHELSCTHSVEIIPNSFYHSNKNYELWEDDFLEEFIDLFPEESLCLLTDDAILPIENIEFEIKGKDFEIKSRSSYLSKMVYDSEIFDDHFYDIFETIFDTHNALINDSFIFEQPLIDINTLPSSNFLEIQFLNKEFYENIKQKNGLSENVQDLVSNLGSEDDINYSLAA